jgi:hypothetical protein
VRLLSLGDCAADESGEAQHKAGGMEIPPDELIGFASGLDDATFLKLFEFGDCPDMDQLSAQHFERLKRLRKLALTSLDFHDRRVHHREYGSGHSSATNTPRTLTALCRSRVRRRDSLRPRAARPVRVSARLVAPSSLTVRPTACRRRRRSAAGLGLALCRARVQRGVCVCQCVSVD